MAWMGATPALRDVLTGDLAPLMARAGSLIHAAASLDHGPGQAALAENREGTARVMAAAREAGIAPVVHICTDSVLKTGPLRQVNETTPYPARPGGYSAGKAEAESIALAVRDAMRVMVLRRRDIWGRDEGTVLPRLAEMVKTGRIAEVAGGTHLSSAAHALEAASGMNNDDVAMIWPRSDCHTGCHTGCHTNCRAGGDPRSGIALVSGTCMAGDFCSVPCRRSQNPLKSNGYGRCSRCPSDCPNASASDGFGR